ncbi:unnamed protein product [Peronospora belbahrii]|nr:unnamed protein product [Peronospora belbahrii]
MAMDTNVLHSLQVAQMTFCSLWNSSDGGKVNTLRLVNGFNHERTDICTCYETESSNEQGSRKRPRAKCNVDMVLDPSMQVLLSHCTAEYQANNPSEDRSANIVKATDAGVQIHAVFDDHGGSRAEQHLCTSLCQHIIAKVTSKNSSDEIYAIDNSAFSRSDQELKQSLLALPPDVHMSKDYCNAGSCAVIALFINSVLYVANVGNCAAVLGKVSDETQELKAIEVSADHSCNNPHEMKLVVECSHDQNAIRMSKDDQATGAGIIGVKRVAGSLAITRAFGDFYLKCPELSSAPFKSKVPYITSEPSITTVHMDGSENCPFVNKFDLEQSLFFATAGAALIHAALEKTAHRNGMMVHY